VNASQSVRRKHIPQRTCIGCRTIQAKRSLIRVVRQPNGIQVDLTGKRSGRGAYLHNLRACWERGLKGGLAQALKAELTPDDRQRLQAFMDNLPEGDPEAEATM
jgi:predicted RNA-binding protein YlxR (DUF448 family)